VRTKFTARKALKGEQQVLSGADLLKEADGLRALRDTYLKVWTPRIIRYVNTVPVPKAIYLPKEI
jgi:hypothetical protein